MKDDDPNPFWSLKINNIPREEEMSSVSPEISKDAAPYRPYNATSQSTAFFHILFEPLLPAMRPLMKVVHAIRWELARPLNTRILPRWVPSSALSPLHEANFITYGQIILVLPLVALLLGGYYLAFVSPDVEGSGSLAGYALIAVFLTASKSNSVFSFLLGISFERMIIFHNLSSLTAVTLALFHAYVPYAHGDGDGNGDDGSIEDRRLSSDDSSDSIYSLNGSDPNLIKFLLDGDENISGSILALTMILLVFTSIFPVFRRKFFDFWLWIHIALIICVVIFSVMHELGAIVGVFAIWWGLDIMMRYMIMATCRYPRKAKLDIVTKDVVKISFVKPKNFSYNAGQFVQIAFPDLGVFEFHPISISSAPHERKVTIHVRALGHWTKKLFDLAKKTDEVSILIEGPYGCVSVDADNDERYQMALFVCGGIGVTHCQSVAKSILNERKRGRKLKQLRFVWAMRDLEMLKVMDPLETSKDFLDIMIDENESETSWTDLVQTDIFLTRASSKSPTTLEDGRRVYYGRPNVKEIIKDVEANAKRLGVSHVAVFGCGPKALLNQVQELCRSYSCSVTEINKDGVKFDVHEEKFDF